MVCQFVVVCNFGCVLLVCCLRVSVLFLVFDLFGRCFWCFVFVVDVMSRFVGDVVAFVVASVLLERKC